jgi:tetratricopeptide (TPR) repeat protein
MSAPQTDIPSWTRSSWVKWSWLLVVAVIVAQSLSYHWRVLPTSAAGYYARGHADFLTDHFESAVDNLTKSIERNAKDADSYIYRGEAYAKLREFGKAMPDLEKALQLRPDYERSHAGSGDVKVALWDTKGALDAYSRALEADPNYARCYLERGMLSYDTEHWSDAAADFRRSARLLLTDKQVTAQLLVWMARARAGDASGATDELSDVMKATTIRGDRFWAGAQFLSGQIAEPAYLAAVANMKGDDVDALKAEAFFLAGGKRLAFGDRAGGLTLMRNALATEADNSYAYDRARVALATLLVGFHPMWTERADAGLAIASVTPGGPAEAAGIRPGFILASINGADAGQDSFTEFLAAAEPGSTVELQLKDGAGASVTIPLTLTPGSSAPTR